MRAHRQWDRSLSAENYARAPRAETYGRTFGGHRATRHPDPNRPPFRICESGGKARARCSLGPVGPGRSLVSGTSGVARDAGEMLALVGGARADRHLDEVLAQDDQQRPAVARWLPLRLRLRACRGHQGRGRGRRKWSFGARRSASLGVPRRPESGHRGDSTSAPLVAIGAHVGALGRPAPSAALLCRGCESRRGACRRPDPRRLASARRSRSPWPSSHRAPTAGLLLQGRVAVACSATVGAPFNDGQAQASGPCNNGIVARAFRRRRTRRRRPPPTPRTDR